MRQFCIKKTDLQILSNIREHVTHELKSLLPVSGANLVPRFQMLTLVACHKNLAN